MDKVELSKKLDHLCSQTHIILSKSLNQLNDLAVIQYELENDNPNYKKIEEISMGNKMLHSVIKKFVKDGALKGGE